MKYLLAGALAMFATAVQASPLSCAALANSPGAEPLDYARQCLGILAPRPTAKSPLPAAADDDVVAYAAQITNLNGVQPQGLYRFALEDFAGAERIGEAADTPNMFGLDFSAAGTRLYGVQTLAAGGGVRLGTFNLATGVYRPSALVLGLSTREQTTGLTIDPRTGQAYLSTIDILTNNPQLSEARLYRLDPTTGFVTLVGRMLPDELNPVIIDIAMNCSGELYAHNITDDSLYAVDPASGEATLVGGHGLPANFAQGMDFDNASGELYAWIYTGAGNNRFGTLDLETGSFQAQADTGPPGQWEGAIPTDCAFMPVDPQAITGAWFAPYTNGQGFTARHYPESGQLFMPWFTYSIEGGSDIDEQRWYALFGQIDTDNDTATSVDLAIVQVLGGSFAEPPSVQGTVVGQASLSFYSCSEGVLEYQFDPGHNGGAQGRTSLSRILRRGTDCRDYTGDVLPAQGDYEPLFSGSWYDPEVAGQGVELFRIASGEGVIGQFYGAWFTFAPDAEDFGPADQRWFTFETQTIDSNGVLTSTIVRTVGGSFDNEQSPPASRAGTATFTSQACDRLLMTYEFDDAEVLGDFQDRSGEIELRRLGDCPEVPED